MVDCIRCGELAQEHLYRPSTEAQFWLCPGCMTGFGEFLEEDPADG